MIPVELQGFTAYIVGVSGGKDSTATALWALDILPSDRVYLVHNPTGAGWPENELYLKYLAGVLGHSIEHVRSGDRPLPPLRNGKPRAAWYTAPTLFEMVRGRGRWPSYWQRYCTRYLKQFPTRLYAREFERPVLIMGERAEESDSRAQLPQFDSHDEGFKEAKAYKVPVYRPILRWPQDDVWHNSLTITGLN